MTAMIDYSLQGLYDDHRTIIVTPSINGEVVVTVTDDEPLFFFADDLLTLVQRAAEESEAALRPTEETPS
jgi:hypothetical protein